MDERRLRAAHDRTPPRRAAVPRGAEHVLGEIASVLGTGLDHAGGRRITFQQRSIGRLGHFAIWVDEQALADRQLRSHLGRKLARHLRTVRDLVADRDQVVVLTATAQLTTGGDLELELDPTTKLDGEDFNSESAYLTDLARCPRDGEQVPVWMRPVLARWGAWDPEAGRLTVDAEHRPNGTPVDMPDVEVDHWLPFGETPEGPRRAHGYGDGNVGPGHTVATPDELAAWRRANT